MGVRCLDHSTTTADIYNKNTVVTNTDVMTLNYFPPQHQTIVATCRSPNQTQGLMTVSLLIPDNIFVCFANCNYIITSLAKEVMFLVALVSLSVCLSVDNITQKVMNGLG